MCVSLKHGLIIVCNDFRLHVHSLLDGSLVRSIGGEGTGKEEYMFHYGGLCVSPDGDSVLVAEQYNMRVQQLKIADGSWVRFVGVGVLEEPEYVDCNTDAIAVSETWSHRISVLAWTDGSVLAQFGSLGIGPGKLDCPRGLRLLCGGNELVVADEKNNRLCLFTVTGEFVSVFASKHVGRLAPRDVIENGADDGFIAANCNGMNLTHVSRDGAVTGVLDSTITSAIRLNKPYALAALPEGGLVVREYERLHVFNGLNVRLAWITACVVIALSTRGLHS
jgi:hypothetical protein